MFVLLFVVLLLVPLFVVILKSISGISSGNSAANFNTYSFKYVLDTSDTTSSSLLLILTFVGTGIISILANPPVSLATEKLLIALTFLNNKC